MLCIRFPIRREHSPFGARPCNTNWYRVQSTIMGISWSLYANVYLYITTIVLTCARYSVALTTALPATRFPHMPNLMWRLGFTWIFAGTGYMISTGDIRNGSGTTTSTCF